MILTMCTESVFHLSTGYSTMFHRSNLWREGVQLIKRAVDTHSFQVAISHRRLDSCRLEAGVVVRTRRAHVKQVFKKWRPVGEMNFSIERQSPWDSGSVGPRVIIFRHLGDRDKVPVVEVPGVFGGDVVAWNVADFRWDEGTGRGTGGRRKEQGT